MKDDELSISELVKLKTNLGPWLSKEKAKIESEKDEDKKKQRVAKYEAQLTVFNRVKQLLS